MTASIPTIGHDNRAALTIVLAGSVVLALAFGVRSVFGGVIQPLSNELFGGSIEVFSLSIAIQNLVWGLAQPGFGLIADKFGDRRALWLGFVCYVVGMLICILGVTPLAQHVGAGVFVGMGISGTAFGVVLAAVGRAAPEEKRARYLGITSAMGSTGQVILPLLASWLVEWLDWRMTLVVVTFALAPMALCIPFLRSNASQAIAGADSAPIARTVRNAFGHSSYALLSAGFFVCGFHLAFITAHLPNYVQHFCVSTASAAELRALGLQALALAGLANIFGTLFASHLGTRFPRPYVLAAIYALRALAILIFISLPVTPTSVMIFALVMGGLWLSTVPLTSALVLAMFGSRAMGTLFGFVFLSHQLGGFAGVWLGGVFFDRYASYDQIWYLAIALGALSAVAHLLVQERAAPRTGLAYGE
ncbi:MFS transporter [Pleomorphomonas sp. NRK KF1]|uniref:MFS transporter n=1 Tax=Pleomorphomonas sp. NRK KF1 TaxID=2943000 RepID=UPI0020447E25|nr:MFS transporter [Pleomorphomonas sp. NRK KF1]MCM5552923.1 MFS transporter [Pleomorphomonas sp. NRK KF1]